MKRFKAACVRSLTRRKQMKLDSNRGGLTTYVRNIEIFADPALRELPAR
jgi:hypothetical protein